MKNLIILGMLALSYIICSPVFADDLLRATSWSTGIGPHTVRFDVNFNESVTVKLLYGKNILLDLQKEFPMSSRAHTLFLDNLEPSTIYYYRYQLSDDQGNTVLTDGSTFTTTGTDKLDVADKKVIPKNYGNVNITFKFPEKTFREIGTFTQPVISSIKNVAVAAQKDTALVTWESDVHSIGHVSYGISEDYGFTGSLVSEDGRHFAYRLNGLAPGRIFHFMIKGSRGVSFGGDGKTRDMTFMTPSDESTATVNIGQDITPVHIETMIIQAQQNDIQITVTTNNQAKKRAVIWCRQKDD